MSLAYFPLYPDDFEADTAHLSMAEDGAYNRLLRLCWRTAGCSLPDDKVWIYRRLRATSDEDRAVVDVVLAEFFTLQSGRVSNARLMREWLAANASHKKRVSAGSKGGAAKSLKTNETKPSNATAKPKQPEPEPEPDPEPIREEKEDPPTPQGGAVVVVENPPSKDDRAKLDAEFHKVWPHYPRRVGMGQARAAWVKARKRASYETITDALRPFIRAIANTPIDKVPHFSTWLNGDRWTDDPSHATNRSRTWEEDVERIATLPASDDVSHLFDGLGLPPPPLRIEG